MKFDLIFPALSKWALAALSLPFIAIGLMILQNEAVLKTHLEHKFEIAGYDPRDLLTGHYIVFQYLWPKNIVYSCAGDKCYLCKTEKAFSLTTEILQCDESLKLTRMAQGKNPNDWQPDEVLRKYNVPEFEAVMLDKLLRERNAKFEVGLVVYPDHTGQVKNLYINGETLADFLKVSK